MPVDMPLCELKSINLPRTQNDFLRFWDNTNKKITLKQPLNYIIEKIDNIYPCSRARKVFYVKDIVCSLSTIFAVYKHIKQKNIES